MLERFSIVTQFTSTQLNRRKKIEKLNGFLHTFIKVPNTDRQIKYTKKNDRISTIHSRFTGRPHVECAIISENAYKLS